MNDAPHFMKNTRNCWVNQLSKQKNLSFPDFDLSKNIVHQASFKLIQDHYENEKLLNIKTGCSLTYATVYPTSLQRQRVNLALNIFNENLVAALRKIPGSDGTCEFILIFGKFWKIFNINSVKKYIHKNDMVLRPFSSLNNQRFNFLLKFVSWVECWQSLPGKIGKLTDETSHALIFSCQSLISLIKYMISELNFQFVLTYKFQTDYLECQFSKYRQSNGGSYNITLSQVYSAEKKTKSSKYI